MSKQDIQKKPTAAREPMVDVNASSPPLEIVGGKKNGLIRWLLLVGVLGLGGVAFWAATMWNPRPAGKTSQAEEQRLSIASCVCGKRKTGRRWTCSGRPRCSTKSR